MSTWQSLPRTLGRSVAARAPGRLLLFFPLLLALLGGSAAAQGPTVSAQLQTGVAKVGEEIALRVVLEGSQSGTLGDLPQVDGLQLRLGSGPMLERSSDYVNGRFSSSITVSWGIAVQGLQPGDYTIPPIPVEVGGKELATPPLKLRVVRDLAGAEVGFIEIATQPHGRLVDGQPFTLELKFGWDASADINYANLVMPWWGALYGALDLGEEDMPPGARTVQGVTINSGSGIAVEGLPDESRDGRRYNVMRLVRSFVATRSGKLEIPSAVLEFGKVRQMGFFGQSERVRELYVQSPPLSLDVMPLPTKGQPLDYGGAVGSLKARAAVDARDVSVGDSIKLTVTWTGDGNLQFFDAPDPGHMAAFDGFRFYGKTEEKSLERRKVTYDLAPLSADVERIPPLPLSVFDPEQGAYTSVSTDAIPIHVRPLEGGRTLASAKEKGFAPDIRDIDVRPLATLGPWERVHAPADGWIAAGLVLVPAFWLGLRTAVRRRRGDPAAPLERRRRRALRELGRALARAGEPRADLEAFLAFLAARTRENEAAWVGREELQEPLEDVARRVGLPPEAQAELRALLARLEAAVYGGAARVERDELRAAADRLVGAGL